MADGRNRLAGVNLNLFVVLAAVLEHRSATRAAAELGVTPSAVSHGLRELRRLFDDPLFVRAGAGLTPTERARSLEAELRGALLGLDRVLDRQPAFDPARSTRHFTLTTADDAGATVLPALVERVLRAAPGMALDIRHRSEGELVDLAAGRSDLVLRLAGPVPAWATCEALYSETMVCLVRRGHPSVRARLAADDFRRLPHIRISPEGHGASTIDPALSAWGIERRVAVYTWSFLMAPELVARTDAILTMPARMAAVAASRLDLRVVEPPFPLPGFTIDMVWHRDRDDPAAAWLRGLCREAADAARSAPAADARR